MSIDPSPAAPVALDQAEKVRLLRLERTVDRSVEVAGKIAGEALATIRDERLYRMTHRSFEAYVIDRFGFSRATAYRMIEAATAPDPVGELVERAKRESAGQRVSARDTSEPEAGDQEPEQPPLPAAYQPIAADAGRLWATVSGDWVPGQLELVLYPDDPDELPAPSTRVLVAWER